MYVPGNTQIKYVILLRCKSLRDKWDQFIFYSQWQVHRPRLYFMGIGSQCLMQLANRASNIFIEFGVYFWLKSFITWQGRSKYINNIILLDKRAAFVRAKRESYRYT